MTKNRISLATNIGEKIVRLVLKNGVKIGFGFETFSFQPPP
jgi:hypothetical protein